MVDASGTRTCVHTHVSHPLFHCATDTDADADADANANALMLIKGFLLTDGYTRVGEHISNPLWEHVAKWIGHWTQDQKI